ncbi:hypothetical protein BDD12DRAFT_868071 [Trichophaea hybrida]|nr:hypothetical protein BDD12DRAFT_868071 [Trichophaea hybrida]
MNSCCAASFVILISPSLGRTPHGHHEKVYFAYTSLQGLESGKEDRKNARRSSPPVPIGGNEVTVRCALNPNSRCQRVKLHEFRLRPPFNTIWEGDQEA